MGIAHWGIYRVAYLLYLVCYQLAHQYRAAYHVFIVK